MKKRSETKADDTAASSENMDKKRHKRKTSHGMHPPWSRRLRKTFPPENVLRPPCRRNPMQTIRTFILPGNPPDSVFFPRQDRLCRRKNRLIVPPSISTIPCGGRGSKRESPRGSGKNVLAPCFARDEHLRCTAYPDHPGQNRTAGKSKANRGNGGTPPVPRRGRKRQKNTRGKNLG